MSTPNNSYTENGTIFYPNYLSPFFNRLLVSNLVLLLLISVLTILGNTLVLVATWREKSLHEPNKYFIVCLAIADLLVGMVANPLQFYRLFHLLTEGFGAVLIPALCKFYVWIDAFAATASIYTLTFISFDRYLKISKPLHYKFRMTTSRSLKVIFIIFLISTVYATFSLFPFKRCYNFEKKYYTYIAIAAFFLPLIIMMIMYILIFRVARKRHKMLRNGELGQTFIEQTQRATFLQDLKIVRMLATVVGVFLICWGPFFIWCMLHFYEPELTYSKDTKFMIISRNIIFLLPPLNSLCNPIVYGCLDQKYKKAFKRVYQMLMRRPVSRAYEPPNVIELQNHQWTTRKNNNNVDGGTAQLMDSKSSS